MGVTRKPMDSAIDELKANLDKVARVSEWAELMGYDNSKLFSRHFLAHFRERPEVVLKRVRLRSIVTRLRESHESNCVIGWKHSMGEGKALYNYVSYHLGMSPTEIRGLPNEKVQEILENLGSESW